MGYMKLKCVLVKNRKAGRLPPIIGIDTLSLVIDGDENNTQDSINVMRSMIELCNLYGGTAIVVSHNGKDASKGIAGSSKFGNHAKEVINLKLEDGGEALIVIIHKAKFEGPKVYRLPFVSVTLEPTPKHPKPYKTRVLDYKNGTVVHNYFDNNTDDESGTAPAYVANGLNHILSQQQ